MNLPLLGFVVGGCVLGLVVGLAFRRNVTLPILLGAAVGLVLGMQFSGRGDHSHLVLKDQAEFTQKVLNADQPVLVDFYADWCPPCRALAPTIAALAKEYEGRARVYKVDCDAPATRPVAGQYDIQSIPCVILFRNGKPVHRIVGRHDAATYRAKLDAMIGQ